MRIILIVLAVAVSMTLVVSSKVISRNDKIYNDFVNKHGKKHKSHEVELRKAIVAAVADRCEKHNKEAASKGLTYIMGLNKYSDLTAEEHLQRCGFVSLSGHHHKNHTNHSNGTCHDNNKRQISGTVDHRSNLNPIQDQGNCGSCWAFSAAVTMEGVSKIKTGKKLKVSEQWLVDCTSKSNGCNGGHYIYPFNNVIENNKFSPSSEYRSYAGNKKICSSNNQNTKNIKFDEAIKIQGADAILKALSKGPLSAALHANSELQNYKSGIFTSKTCPKNQNNHAVNFVGYGRQNNQIFIWAQNSWGTSWGEGGYFRIYLDNVCGSLSDVYSLA